jgi:hypothetical protein
MGKTITRKDREKRGTPSTKKSAIKKAVKIVEKMSSSSRPPSVKKKVAKKEDYNWKIDGVPAGRALGGAVGGLFGSTGSAVGSAIGGGAHWLFKKITGLGDNRIGYAQKMSGFTKHMSKAGHSQGVRLGGNVPMFSKTGGKNLSPSDTELVWEEPFCVVTGSTGFNNTVYNLNPTAGNFPWLGPRAAGWQQYQWCGVVFQYRPLVGPSATTPGPVGQVNLAVQYNLGQAPFGSTIEAQESSMATNGESTDFIYAAVECDPRDVQVHLNYIYMNVFLLFVF